MLVAMASLSNHPGNSSSMDFKYTWQNKDLAGNDLHNLQNFIVRDTH